MRGWSAFWLPVAHQEAYTHAVDSQHLSFANVISMIALFVALGGTSIAAVSLSKNSVGAKQIKKNAVGHRDQAQRGRRVGDPLATRSAGVGRSIALTSGQRRGRRRPRRQLGWRRRARRQTRSAAARSRRLADRRRTSTELTLDVRGRIRSSSRACRPTARFSRTWRASPRRPRDIAGRGHRQGRGRRRDGHLLLRRPRADRVARWCRWTTPMPRQPTATWSPASRSTAARISATARRRTTTRACASWTATTEAAQDARFFVWFER